MGEHAASILRSVFTLFVVGGVLWVVLEITGIGSDPHAQPTRRTAGAAPTPSPTSTQEPTKSPTEMQEQASYLDPRRLVADPDGHKGENIIVQGDAREVAQKDGFTWIRMDAAVRDRDLSESVVVELRPPNADILREECYRFYGIAAGTQRGVIGFGAVLDPLVDAYAVDPSPRKGSFCTAP